MTNSFINSIRILKHEFSEFERFFSAENKKLRRLVFYAESAIYYLYFRDYIEHILSHSDLEIAYISSDPSDKIFQTPSPRIKPFYIKNLLSLTLSRLDAQVIVMTVPDLNTGVIKRAPGPVHHIYAFHGISSTNQYYRRQAFDHYDSILCIGTYHIEEIRKAEKLYDLKPKELILTGYPLLERLYREHNEYLQRPVTIKERRPLCLIAPTWSNTSAWSTIMESCLDKMIEVLSQTDYQVWLRPHPEYLKRFGKKLKTIEKAIAKTTNISLETDLPSMDCLHKADVLVTDYSTIYMDYVLGTERPALLINTTLNLDKHEAVQIDSEPIENRFRSKMGLQLSPENIDQMPTIVDSLIAQQNEFRLTVPAMRKELVANWLTAAQIGGDYILSKCS